MDDLSTICKPNLAPNLFSNQAQFNSSNTQLRTNTPAQIVNILPTTFSTTFYTHPNIINPNLGNYQVGFRSHFSLFVGEKYQIITSSIRKPKNSNFPPLRNNLHRILLIKLTEAKLHQE